MDLCEEGTVASIDCLLDFDELNVEMKDENQQWYGTNED